MLEHLAGVDLHGQVTRKHVLEKADFISSELGRCIHDFDRELGHVIETICPNPTELSEKEACSIVREYPDVLARACSGTTLAAALVNLTHRLMWAVNVGDSTIGKNVAYLLWRLALMFSPSFVNHQFRGQASCPRTVHTTHPK